MGIRSLNSLNAAQSSGIFTPAIRGGSTAGTGTYTTQVGYWTKIGELVYFEIRLQWSAHTGTGDLIVTGLPFPFASTPSFHIGMQSLTYSGQIGARAGGAGSTELAIESYSSGGLIAGVGMDTAAFIFIAGTYKAQ